MSGPVLSTMWAQQARFQGDFTSFARIARDAGYTGIEVSHSTNEAGLDELLRQSVLPILSLHAPAPHMATHRGPHNSALNLASLDEQERSEAVEHTLRTIDYAGRTGARFMVVHLGAVSTGRLYDNEAVLRRLHAAGRLDTDEARDAVARAQAQRAEAAGPHLEAARRSLHELVAAAAPHGVAIGLENRLHFHEIPSGDETATLIAGYVPEQVGYWHDVGHAEVQARLGLIDARAVLARLRQRLLGVHLHDVRGILDHRAPGNGDVDWSYIAAATPASAARTFEIDQREPEASLASAIGLLRERGVLSPEPAAIAGDA
jgi:sugar phosphate isomerase/epimerase